MKALTEIEQLAIKLAQIVRDEFYLQAKDCHWQYKEGHLGEYIDFIRQRFISELNQVGIRGELKEKEKA